MRGRLVLVIPMLVAVLVVGVVALALSACGSGSQENNKSESGATASTNGQIAFRRYYDPDYNEAALFAMNSDGSHILQITPLPRAGATTFRSGLPMGRRSPSIVRESTKQ